MDFNNELNREKIIEKIKNGDINDDEMRQWNIFNIINLKKKLSNTDEAKEVIDKLKNLKEKKIDQLTERKKNGEKFNEGFFPNNDELIKKIDYIAKPYIVKNNKHKSTGIAYVDLADGAEKFKRFLDKKCKPHRYENTKLNVFAEKSHLNSCFWSFNNVKEVSAFEYLLQKYITKTIYTFKNENVKTDVQFARKRISDLLWYVLTNLYEENNNDVLIKHINKYNIWKSISTKTSKFMSPFSDNLKKLSDYLGEIYGKNNTNYDKSLLKELKTILEKQYKNINGELFYKVRTCKKKIELYKLNIKSIEKNIVTIQNTNDKEEKDKLSLVEKLKKDKLSLENEMKDDIEFWKLWKNIKKEWEKTKDSERIEKYINGNADKNFNLQQYYIALKGRVESVKELLKVKEGGKRRTKNKRKTKSKHKRKTKRKRKRKRTKRKRKNKRTKRKRKRKRTKHKRKK